jgi:hypothetical protein
MCFLGKQLNIFGVLCFTFGAPGINPDITRKPPNPPIPILASFTPGMFSNLNEIKFQNIICASWGIDAANWVSRPKAAKLP